MPVRYLNLLAAAVTLTIGIGLILGTRSESAGRACLFFSYFCFVDLPIDPKLLELVRTIGKLLSLIGGAHGVAFILWEIKLKLKRSRGQ